MCETRMLARHQEAYIGHCIHCRSIFLWHGNLLLQFTPDDFVSFRQSLHEREFCDCSLPFPDHEERVIIHASSPDISLVFTQAEWANLKAAVDEALLMHQVYDLIG